MGIAYVQGRAMAEGSSGVGTKPAAKSDYDAFLALRPAPSSDPLAADARKRRDAIQVGPAPTRVFRITIL